jgi:hypothetical protein
MEQIIECVIAGGPQHGLIRRQLWDSSYAAPVVMATDDGAVCVAAARRPAGAMGERFLLLHPKATGPQILAMLAVLSANVACSYLPWSG